LNGQLTFAGESEKGGNSAMTVARVTEISATSPDSFDDAVRRGIERANKTLRNVTSAWVKEQNVFIENGNITAYKVNILVTFVLEDSAS
jgi:flavin-binding protein dodecin